MRGTVASAESEGPSGQSAFDFQRRGHVVLLCDKVFAPHVFKAPGFEDMLDGSQVVGAIFLGAEPKQC